MDCVSLILFFAQFGMSHSFAVACAIGVGAKDFDARYSLVDKSVGRVLRGNGLCNNFSWDPSRILRIRWESVVQG